MSATWIWRIGGSLVRKSNSHLLGLAVWVLAAPFGHPGEPTPMTEADLQGKLRRLQEMRDDSGRLNAARDLAVRYRLSSQQVKAIARTLTGEDARIEFALAAYPITLDPQNFYEVYDVFESFSKVFRLHDQIHRLRPQPGPTPPAPPIVTGPPPLSDSELAEILRVVGNESFDDKKLALARQIAASAKGRIASRQVGEILKRFAFDDRRLELAKSAYDCVLDPWNYHVVYGTFTFSSNREALSEYIRSHAAPQEPPIPRSAP